MSKVSAYSFVSMLRANVDNQKLDAQAFREFVRNSLPIVHQTLAEDPEHCRVVDEAVGLSQRVERLQQAVDNLA